MKSLRDIVGASKLRESKKYPGVFFRPLTVDETIELEQMANRKPDEDPLQGVSLIYRSLQLSLRNAEGEELPGMDSMETFRKDNDMDVIQNLFTELGQIMYPQQSGADAKKQPKKN